MGADILFCRWRIRPDEYPFTNPELLPKPILAPVTYPRLLWKHAVNVNDQILKFYVESIVPDITRTLGEVRLSLLPALSPQGTPLLIT